MLLLVTPSVQGCDVAHWGRGLMGSNWNYPKLCCTTINTLCGFL